MWRYRTTRCLQIWVLDKFIDLLTLFLLLLVDFITCYKSLDMIRKIRYRRKLAQPTFVVHGINWILRIHPRELAFVQTIHLFMAFQLMIKLSSSRDIPENRPQSELLGHCSSYAIISASVGSTTPDMRFVTHIDVFAGFEGMVKVAVPCEGCQANGELVLSEGKWKST